MTEEKPEELAALEESHEAILSDMKRLKSLHSKGKLSANLADEVVSTIMPLLAELSEKVLGYAESVDEWAQDVEDVLENGGGAGGPTLSPEEVQLFVWLFSRMEVLVKTIQATPETPPEMKTAMVELEKKLKQAYGVLDRFAEALNEAVAEGESEEDADDVDDDE